MWPGANRAKAENGIIVSTEVDTAEPEEALEWPLAARELVARFRAESAAIVDALLEVLLEALKLATLRLVVCVPVGLAPEVETQMSRSVDGSCQ